MTSTPPAPQPLVPSLWEATPARVVCSQMSQNRSITLYRWILSQFVADGPRAREAVRVMGPEIAPLIRSGDHVLDLCCGAGTWSFFAEKQGAAVVAIDQADFMIEQAQRDADQRRSRVQFVQADVLDHEFGDDTFDLAMLMGNTIADLAPSGFSPLAKKTHRALKGGGTLVVHYIDGVVYFERERFPEEAVEQEDPVRITRRYQEYRPGDAARVMTYTNESTGETYSYTTYVYPAGLLRTLLDPHFELTRSVRVGEASFLDVFTKREG